MRSSGGKERPKEKGRRAKVSLKVSAECASVLASVCVCEISLKYANSYTCQSDHNSNNQCNATCFGGFNLIIAVNSIQSVTVVSDRERERERARTHNVLPITSVRKWLDVDHLMP